MGCRCCKMIQSYIFDPQEVQTSGYINEINNYKSDRPDGGKPKRKHNVEIQVHKNELQNAESQPSVNRNKLNNTKDAVRNCRNTALHEEGLSNCLEKINVNINGVPSHSNLKSNHNANQNKEAGTHVSSAQLNNSSAKGLSPPKEGSDTNLEADHPTTESSRYRQLPTTGENGSLAQRATLEAQSLGSPDPDFSKNASQQTVVGCESLSKNHTHSTPSTERTILNKHGDQALCESPRCDSGDQASRTGTLNGCLRDKTFSDIPSPRPQPEALVEAGEVCCGEANGDFEEEDADIAEALAALEAATAGEDFEEVEEEY
uniref:uncharacterized protein C4orf19 homolog n=1 Tax=Euleptes europaea TaxID=460621 RepID=UPI0025416C9E|nr:uncharacterized protein C4orf19 homolog [Euleptes europaea]